jgi:hypothetical protein
VRCRTDFGASEKRHIIYFPLFANVLHAMEGSSSKNRFNWIGTVFISEERNRESVLQQQFESVRFGMRYMCRY